MFNLGSDAQSQYPPMNQPSYMTPQNRNVRLYFGMGVVCAVISLIIIPEIFGSAAIILGAYTWKLESAQNSNRGLLLMLVAIVLMFVGLYYTAFYSLYNVLP